MTGQNLEIISQIVLWYENILYIDCSVIRLILKAHLNFYRLNSENI